ncbi:pentaheme c-type cytochrome TorC [Photobacterium phosphoreum]|jgi:trimethylamine-N-oxide reductase cytochrome c-type subunit TorC|uniref:Cytochrome c-type protein n=1 Tax=Photobacterium phosphoreum TaxID=659 RepID=A0AAW4ZTQ1_PHOPO|nr:pentaheme c-type cytochrome TorC [Photobacterium phosphoreum]MCD9470054.1 pentaheme c-type cytochrome TorC [Photobacterium phosphoreum]MCD9474589.1 pentaheme c-type cytochrome TorC [Photobacterium phosphoreum]MCD9482646.1 pentaheme c-type cytochrome TorC [Photobacterium phosphoreum]MCD9490304.1 pentaheme c-type cytochrome TorC [Photobacterium phosphoreum]MCD9506183.1 pentaheme c-type cytochrome TorC [Photobacterium phosphoreum]
MKKLWRFLVKPSSRYSVLAIAVVCVIITLAGVFTFHESIKFSSTTEFCTSCHSMKENYNEYKTSIHYKNAYGVRAECRDCHIPENNPIAFMKAKLGGVGDIYSEFISKDIDTPAKFEANRLRMAQNVWRMMAETNSATCKSCHSYTAMDHAKQSPAAAAAMTGAAAKDMNCIECHKGIAHQLPHINNDFQATFKQLTINSGEAPATTILYSLASKKLYTADSTSGDVQGQLYPASEVKVLGTSGDMLKVQMTGWQQQGSTTGMLVQDMAKQIQTVSLNADLQKSATILNTVKAEDGQTWQQLQVSAWISQRNMLASIKPIWAYGKEILDATCSQCHAIPDPKHLTANGWVQGLKAMQQYYMLNKDEERTLLKYLQDNAKDAPVAATPAAQ